jgi:nicotinamide mononucleotide adenylyltransferase
MKLPSQSRPYYVFLGRFAPLQIGHQLLIDSLIARYGLPNVLLLVGSSNSYNPRTPYTYAERKEMIQAVYPGIKVAPLPDINPTQIHFDGLTNDLWLDRLQQLEKKMAAEFIFFGGSQEDLSVLSQRFKTIVLVNRHRRGLNISATQVRQALAKNDEKALDSLLSPLVLPLARSGYHRYQKQPLAS